MKTKKASALQLNKKSIAKLNDKQLQAIKGGVKVGDLDCPTSSYTCNTSTCS